MVTKDAKMSGTQHSAKGAERRAHRRHSMENRGLSVKRIDHRVGAPVGFGQLMDISPSGVRIRVLNGAKPDPNGQLRVRIELPAFGMIAPFLDTTGRRVQPSNAWTGWIEVCRVHPVDEYHSDVAGRILDMREMERGMLGLYLSTQPMAA